MACPETLLQVYDVTNFLDDHPGGDEVLLLAAGKIVHPALLFPLLILESNVENITSNGTCKGLQSWLFAHVAEKDATEDFEDVGHSENARLMMEQYYVGKVDMSTLPEKPNYKPPQQAAAAVLPPQGNQPSGSALKILQFLVPLLILGLAYALQYLRKKD